MADALAKCKKTSNLHEFVDIQILLFATADDMCFENMLVRLKCLFFKSGYDMICTQVKQEV